VFDHRDKSAAQIVIDGARDGGKRHKGFREAPEPRELRRKTGDNAVEQQQTGEQRGKRDIRHAELAPAEERSAFVQGLIDTGKIGMQRGPSRDEGFLVSGADHSAEARLTLGCKRHPTAYLRARAGLPE